MNPGNHRQLETLVGEPVDRFTFHAAGMLLLDRIESISSDSLTCSWTVPDEHPLLTVQEGLPAYVGIECMAQCVAVLAGAILSLEGEGPRLGLLLGTRKFRASDPFLHRGDELHISCREVVRDAQGLAAFDCMIQNQDGTLASCRLTVYQTQEPFRGHDLG